MLTYLQEGDYAGVMHGKALTYFQEHVPPLMPGRSRQLIE
jgi:hypothetical protein